MKKNLCIFAFLSLSLLVNASEPWYQERLYDQWGQTLKISNTLFEEKTSCQDLIVFENSLFGRVLALDGVIQTTESDEFVYHEMMTHVPLLAHGNARKVLIIGGGDGGILREVLRHKTVELATMVEIDGSVVEMCKKYLPNHSNGAFEDPRTQLIIQDGCVFVKNSNEKFDVIICDSTDPIGPGKVLFTPEFYADCKSILNEGGIMVNQNGVPFLQGSTVTLTYRNRSPYFKDTLFYIAAIPTYVGGNMAFGWASDNGDYLQIPEEELAKRLQSVSGVMRYYTPAIHKAAFALPKYIQDLVPPI